jgi:hypothetical protein
MNKESLNKIKEKFVDIIENTNIENADKLELLMNICLFLDNYEDNIKILQQYGKRRKNELRNIKY